ncbi:glycosyltransferase [Bacillus sp. FJAT-50079]|uniref:glycosyltransferase n=1 Tax=Bacillus sp. FJAT-50079 TaxID=2833577 RepID=UPI001BC8E72F|nr:glycosyltransferase [Bacillus sp. FJAT-50079]MBS4206750.1 glycosyltransferase [Bacillus sp. FJAT-50079]
MKIMIIPSWYPTEDNPLNGIFFKEQAQALLSDGIDVTITYPEIHTLRSTSMLKLKKGISVDKEDGLITYRYRAVNYFPGRIPFVTACKYYLLLKSLVKKAIKEHGIPDIIHAHSTHWGGWAAAKISRKYGIPLIITEHSSKFVRDLLKPYEKKEAKKTFEIAKKVIAVGPSLEKELLQYTPSSKLIRIPNIVDLSGFQIDRSNEKKERKFRFLSIAFLNKNKGIDLLIRAFEKVFKHQEVELIIGGEGPEMDKLTKLTDDLGLSEQIHFLGLLDRDEVKKQMGMCDSFVSASEYETFGVVLIEALACGKPIISTKSGGPDEIVTDENGILVPTGDITALSVAMQKMINSYSTYSAERIREQCKERFGEEAIIRKIRSIYEQELRGNEK